MKKRCHFVFLILITLPMLFGVPRAALQAQTQPSATASASVKQTTPDSKADVSPKSALKPEQLPAADAKKLPGIAKLTNARATFIEFMSRAKAGKSDAAAQCLDVAGRSPAETHMLVWKLKNIIERIPDINVDIISDSPGDVPHVIDTGIKDNPIAIAANKNGVWLFTADTVDSIDGLYEYLADTAPVNGHDWLRDFFPAGMLTTKFLLPTYQWACLFGTILAGIIIDFIARAILRNLTVSWFKFRKIKIEDSIRHGYWKPVGLLVRGLVWYGGTRLLDLPPNIRTVLLAAICFFAIVAGVWTAFLLIDLLAKFLMGKAQQTDTRYDDLLVPLVSRTLKAFAVCAGIVIFAETFDFSIAGLLGGMGIGGVALAFAAKDTVANLFGSLTVLTDRPFEIGDWIVTDKVEGSVEMVGIRSTRVRTFYNSLVIVPNSVLTTAVLDNMGKRRYRRIKTYLGLQYDTPTERIDAFCEGTRELLRRHPYTRKDYYHVYLNRFSESSLDVLLYCFLECPDWSVELRERHRLFVDIIKLAKQLGVSFAFPSRTLYMFQEEHAVEPGSMPSGPSSTGRRLAAEIAGPLPPPHERPGVVEFVGPHDVGEQDESDE